MDADDGASLRIPRTFERVATAMVQGRCALQRAWQQLSEAEAILAGPVDRSPTWPWNELQRERHRLAVSRGLEQIRTLQRALMDLTVDLHGSPNVRLGPGDVTVRFPERLVVAPIAGVIKDRRFREHERLEPGALLCSVSGEKYTVTLNSPVMGTLRCWLVDEGERVAAGRILIRIRPDQ